MIDHHGKAIEDMRENWCHLNATTARVHEQLGKIRTIDFGVLLGVSLCNAIGTLILIAKVYS